MDLMTWRCHKRMSSSRSRSALWCLVGKERRSLMRSGFNPRFVNFCHCPPLNLFLRIFAVLHLLKILMNLKTWVFVPWVLDAS